MNPPSDQVSKTPDSIKKNDPQHKSPKENIQISSGKSEKLENAEKAQHEVQLLHRSSKSLAGSSSSKLSSSITGPVETQESMTFAVSELSGRVASGVHLSEENNQTQEFTAQFSFFENEGRSEMNIEKPITTVQERSKMVIEDPVASLVNKGWKSFAQSMQNENNQLMTIYKDPEPPKTEKKFIEDLASKDFTPDFAGGQKNPEELVMDQQPQPHIQIRKPLQDLMSFAKPQPMIEEGDQETFRSRRSSISSHQTNRVSILPSFQDFMKAHKTQNENIKPLNRETPLSNRSSSGSGKTAAHQQSPSNFIRSNYPGLRNTPLPLSPCANPSKPKTNSSSTTTENTIATTSIQSAKSSLNEGSLLLTELPVIMEDPEINKQAGKKSKRTSSRIDSENVSETLNILESSELTSESHDEYCSTCGFESSESQYEDANESDYNPDEDEDYYEEESGPIVLLNRVNYVESPECTGRPKRVQSLYKEFDLDPEDILSHNEEADEENEETSEEEKEAQDKKKQRSENYSDFMMNLKQQNYQFYKEMMGVYTKQDVIKENDEEEEYDYEYDYEEGTFSTENEAGKGSCETIKYSNDKGDDQKPKKVIFPKKKIHESGSQATENKESLGSSNCKKKNNFF